MLALSIPEGVNPAAVSMIALAAIAALIASQVLSAVVGLPARWWRRIRGPRARRVIEAAPQPLRQDLTAATAPFAATTRMLLGQVAHAQARVGEWHDGARPGVVARVLGLRSDDDYQPTIELFGEVSRWLQHASALVRDDGPDAPEIREACARVRGLVLADGELPTRIDGITAALRELDARFSTTSASPYRDRHHRAPATATDDDTSERARVLARHEALFRSVAARYADDAAGREDLLQEIRIAVWVALPHHRGDASLTTYIRRIAHYCGARFGRRQFKIDSVDEPVDQAPSLLDQLADAERRAALRAALSTLPCGQRQAVDLLLSGASYREIASHLGITETNASVRIARARKQLRKRLVPVFA
ncbi:MAG: sigma-70 family RNA polymerase sigma factor [Myxococcales bacterium]|nr:sigma-70 family RNA polymerase sigma factor [Myxococcales bacterium]